MQLASSELVVYSLVGISPSRVPISLTEPVGHGLHTPHVSDNQDPSAVPMGSQNLSVGRIYTEVVVLQVSSPLKVAVAVYLASRKSEDGQVLITHGQQGRARLRERLTALFLTSQSWYHQPQKRHDRTSGGSE